MEPMHMDVPVSAYQQDLLPLCTDTGCSLELLEAMDDREEWWESLGNQCQQCDMMMMIMIYILNIYDL